MSGLLLFPVLFFLLYVPLAIVVAWTADRRGRTGLHWFVVAMLVTPFVAGLLLVLVTRRRPPTAWP